MIAFPKAKLVVPYDLLKTDFNRKASEINVLATVKEKSKHEFSVMEIRYYG